MTSTPHRLRPARITEPGDRKVAGIRDTSEQDRQLDPALGQRRRRLKMAGFGAAVLLLVGIAVLIVGHWSGAAHSIPIERVRIAEVVRGQLVRDVAARGTVVAAVSPTLYSPAAGTVAFDVRAGDRVAKGQVLARVDSPELRNELEREQATLASLEIAVDRQTIETRRQILASKQASDMAGVAIQAAERELQRAEDSWAERLISERDYEKARDDAAEARLTHAHAVENASLEKEGLEFELRTRVLERDRQRLLVENLRRRVGNLDVESPVDGIVGNLAVAERSAVGRDAPLLTVVDLSQFEIEFQVPETYADDLGLGMPGIVTYSNHEFPARVSAVSPEVRDGQVTGRLQFDAEVPAGLRQNQRVSARILLETRADVLKVARGPFIDSAGGRIAYVVRDGTAIRSPITLGAMSIGEVEVARGLEAGDRIVVSSLDAFEGAESVRLVD
jgi:HlyD family secretion protein